MEAPRFQDRATEKGLEFLDRVLGSYQPRNFAVRLWDGAIWGAPKTDARFTLVLKHPSSLRRMFIPPTQLALGEAYIFDDFDIEGDLGAALKLGDHLVGLNPGFPERIRMAMHLLGLSARARPDSPRRGARLRGRNHSRRRDRQAVTYHYNVSNDFYRLWLDRRMVYSCAYFTAAENSLDTAQEAKLDYICRKLRLRPGERLIDIGCGWGGLILHAVRNYGVEALGITLSQPQADFANEAIRASGLERRCQALVCDYRDLAESRAFDKMVSVGMFEHVGRKCLPNYFAQAFRLLRPGGVFLNHGITSSLANPFPEGPSFIDRYVFPDGELVPISATLECAEAAGFEPRDLESLREHYALTLDHWVKRLEQTREEAVRLTDETTYRIWRIYMAGSAHGFRTGRLNLYQALLVRPDKGRSGMPLARDDWYH